MCWRIVLIQDLNAAKSQKLQSVIFSFDFRGFYAMMMTGRTQAAFSSHKKVAPSTFSVIRTIKALRAVSLHILTFATWLWSGIEWRLQAPIDAPIFGAAQLVKKFRRAHLAKLVRPALFVCLPLGPRDLWGISAVPMTARVNGFAATLATQLTRPMIQKVRIC
jgi:hypothetical protein